MSLPLIDVGAIIAIVGLVLSVLKLYLEQRKTKKDLELAKEYLQNLSRFIDAYIRSSETHQQLEKQKLEWSKMKDIGKTLFKLIEYSEGEEE